MPPLHPGSFPQLRRISRIMTNVARSAHAVQPEGVFAVPEFCDWCGTPVDGFDVCYPCKQIRDSTELSQRPDNIALLTYAIHGSQSAADAYGYKDPQKPPASNQSLSRLQILTNFFIYHHSGCFRATAGQPARVITHVPSGKGRTPHPLGTQIEPLFPEEQLRRVPLQLTHAPRTEGRSQGVDPQRYEVQGDVEGEHVIVLEDTWVRGHSALSAVRAVRDAGASIVSLLVLTRYLQPDYPATEKWLSKQQQLAAYDPTFCPVTKMFSCPDS